MLRRSLFVLALVLLPSQVSAAPLVTLDPGHGGRYSGATNCKYSFEGESCLQEADVNLDVALRAQRILSGWGFRVRMTRTTDALVNSPEQDIETWNEGSDGSRTFFRDGRIDVRDDLQARVNVSDCDTRQLNCPTGAVQSEVFLSIHNNACGCGARGTETYHAGSTQGRLLAESVQDATLQSAQRPNRGVQQSGFYVVRYTRAASALLEGAFVDNDEEARLMRDPAFRERLAEGAARGVARYLALTAVSARHSELGGRFGAQVSEEAEVSGGWVSRHEHGQFFWRPDHGPFVVNGGILVKYGQMAGAHNFGLPTTDEIDVRGGRATYFERGRIYWSDATGARLTHGAILGKYIELDAAEGYLRLPVSDEEAVPGGRVSYFQMGQIYWSPQTGAHLVYGAIHHKYVAAGGSAKWGMATADETPVVGGRRSTFERAHVYWSPETDAHLVNGAILDKYISLGGPDSNNKLPITDEMDTSGGRVSHFQGGRIYWGPSTGAAATSGGILSKYLEHDGPDGFLRLPTSDEKDSGTGRMSQFQNGHIYWSHLSGAQEVHGAILSKYLELGASGSSLGFPTSDEFGTPTGARSNFQGGYITWDQLSGDVTVHRT